MIEAMAIILIVFGLGVFIDVTLTRKYLKEYHGSCALCHSPLIREVVNNMPEYRCPNHGKDFYMDNPS